MGTCGVIPFQVGQMVWEASRRKATSQSQGEVEHPRKAGEHCALVQLKRKGPAEEKLAVVKRRSTWLCLDCCVAVAPRQKTTSQR